MLNANDNVNVPSPFHPGEQQLQRAVGVREQSEQLGRRMIRSFMPDQHREFYSSLPYIFLGHVDADAKPWASILLGKPGFISSQNNKQLEIDTAPIAGDPLEQSLKPNNATPMPLGLLGIELNTRRRNRMNGIGSIDQDGILKVQVDQSFGNCPQYIQTRDIVERESFPQSIPPISHISSLGTEEVKIIAKSDTFFVASYVASRAGMPSEGVDVSHRGGQPGFIRIDNESRITIPDYSGNNAFNTLGNFLENPKAGLLFIDFERGDLLTLTGTTEVILDSPDLQYFTGAERLWTFTLDHGYWLKNALPFKWQFNEYSANSLLTGTWREAEEKHQAEKLRTKWRQHKVVQIVTESADVKSLYLEALDGLQPTFKSGQFLTLGAAINGNEQQRTYTVSSAPTDNFLRISVKRQPSSPNSKDKENSFSNYLHSRIKVGDTINAKAPIGNFTFDPEEQRPAVLISAGIGITPMIAMAREAFYAGIRKRSPRPIFFINVARDENHQAFYEEINKLALDSAEQINATWILSQPKQRLSIKDYQYSGRLSKKMLQEILPLDDYDFFLCGPDGFMQTSYDLLRELGVNNQHIYAEAFGPSALKRSPNHAAPAHRDNQEPEIADTAIVTFSDAKFEQPWTAKDGTLLEFAEAHGLTPEYGCRNGQCGACSVKLEKGRVSYEQTPAMDLSDNQVLICCAKPAADKGTNTSSIILKM